MNAKRLLQHFDRISEAPDAIPRLRRFILDLAVRGKLVDQDPDDEPAAELLKRIQAEKAKLVARRRIRQETDVDYSVSQDEAFAPKEWFWVHIDDVALVQGGKRLPTGATFSKEKTPHIYIRVTDMKDGTILTNDVRFITPEVQCVISQYTINKEDLYITIAGTIGQVGRVPENFDGQNLTENAAKIVFRELDANFFRMALSSEAVQQQFRDKTKQMAQPKLALKRIAGARVPLPPLAEQHRIVAKVDELMALCDQLEAAKLQREQSRDRLVAASLNLPADAAKANAPDAFRDHARFTLQHFPRLTTSPEHIKQLRQTILNLAVRGNLVPQDPNDEPAAELLKRIQAEKALLVKEGKVRGQEPLALVEDSDIPFDIPGNWKWVRLGDVLASSFYGPRFGAEEYTESGVPTIRTTDMTADGRIVLRNPPMVNLPADRLEDFRCDRGDLLITRTGSIGTMAVFTGDYPAIPSAYLIRLRFTTGILVTYIHCWLRSPRGQAVLGLNTTKVAQPNINAKNLAAIPISLPPLAEQRRIVARVDELMALCDQLETQLNTTEADSRSLLEATLHEALAPALEETA